MDKEGEVHTYNEIQTMKKNKILLFIATWMDPETITLSELSQTGKDKYYIDITYMQNLKKIVQMELFTKQNHRHRKQTFGLPKGKGGESKN